MTNEVMARFNMKGNRGKVAFGNTTVFAVVKGISSMGATESFSQKPFALSIRSHSGLHDHIALYMRWGFAQSSCLRKYMWFV